MRTFATVPASPRHLHTYKVSGQSQGWGSVTHASGHRITTDVPAQHGGQDLGAQPVELLLGALIGCEVATARYVAKQMRPPFPLQDLKFSLFAERDPQGPRSLPLEKPLSVPAQVQRVWGSVEVILEPNSPPEPLARVQFLCEQTEKRCPIAALMHGNGCKFEIIWDLEHPVAKM